MDLKLSSCTVLVHDPGKALAFYRDVLGFEVRSDTEFESRRWVSVGPPSQPGLDIVLMPPGAALNPRVRGSSPWRRTRPDLR